MSQAPAKKLMRTMPRAKALELRPSTPQKIVQMATSAGPDHQAAPEQVERDLALGCLRGTGVQDQFSHRCPACRVVRLRSFFIRAV